MMYKNVNFKLAYLLAFTLIALVIVSVYSSTLIKECESEKKVVIDEMNEYIYRLNKAEDKKEAIEYYLEEKNGK